MLGALTQQALNVLFLGCTSLVAIGLGRLVLCRTGIRFVSSGEWAVFCAGLGFGILSYAVFLLCALQVLYPEAVYILFGLCTALGLAGWLKGRCGSDKTTFSATELTLWDKAFLIVLATCLFFAFLLVLTPAIGKDALIYHLAVPKLFGCGSFATTLKGCDNGQLVILRSQVQAGCCRNNIGAKRYV